jgi:cell wall-active antibiotic response 4TMS protein YvqF
MAEVRLTIRAMLAQVAASERRRFAPQVRHSPVLRVDLPKNTGLRWTFQILCDQGRADMSYRDHTTWQRQPEPNGGNISPGLIFGLAIIAVGVLFLLGNFGVPVGFLWEYWPVTLIAVGLAKLVDSRDTSGRTAGAILMLVGLVLIADKIHLPFLRDKNLWDLWPLAIIVFGFMMLWGALEGKGMVAGTPWRTPSAPGSVSMFSIFGGSNRKVSGDFKGADLVAIFGGGGLDLRYATMSADEAVVNVNAIFGGFEIRAPDNWQVQVQVSGIFGGHEDKTHQPDPNLVPNPKRLLIRGATIFGGLGVKN